MSADLILTITDRSRGGDFSAWFREQGATLVLTALGRGTATTEVLEAILIVLRDQGEDAAFDYVRREVLGKK